MEVSPSQNDDNQAASENLLNCAANDCTGALTISAQLGPYYPQHWNILYLPHISFSQ